MNNALKSELLRFYSGAAQYFTNLKKRGEGEFAEYIALVAHYAQKDAKILDLGCGTGQSSWYLAQKKFSVVGGDLSPTYVAFAQQRYKDPRLTFRVADALKLPFPDSSFEAVAGFEFIEHLPDIPRALSEMARVLKPGGYLVLMGPNLCSPLFGLLDFLRMMAGGSPRPVWGETKGQALRWASDNFIKTLTKLGRGEPEFLYRTPDLSGRIVGADADSVYLACPIDLERYLRKHSFVIHQLSGGPFSLRDRVIRRLLPRWAPGIKLVAEKR